MHSGCVSQLGRSALHLAAHAGRLETCEFLLLNGACADTETNVGDWVRVCDCRPRCSAAAVRTPVPPVARLLLLAYVLQTGETALMTAMEEGHTEVAITIRVRA